DGGDEGGVDHGGAEAEGDGGQGAGEQGVVEQGEGEDEAGGLDEHAGDDEGFAADAVGEVAGGDLADAPQDGVEALDEADGGQAEAVVGEEKGEDAPGE